MILAEVLGCEEFAAQAPIALGITPNLIRFFLASCKD